MKYEKPNMSIIFLEDANVITTSVTDGPLIPGVDTGEDKFGADD